MDFLLRSFDFSHFFFLLSGFISLKVYDLLIPNERLSPYKYFLEIIFYSLLHFAIFYILVEYVGKSDWSDLAKYFSFLFIFLLVPIAYPISIIKLMNIPRIKKYMIHPLKRPWDYVFDQRKRYWIIVHLQNGVKLGGLYGENSFASSFPAEEQIYLEKAYDLDPEGNFLKEIDRSEGMVILGKDMLMLELYGFKPTAKPAKEKNHGKS